MIKSADRLEQNRDRLKKFLIRHNWKIKDMTGHEWVVTQYGDHIFGKTIDKNLINTNGVFLDPLCGGRITIATWGADSQPVGHYIICNKNVFKICK